MHTMHTKTKNMLKRSKSYQQEAMEDGEGCCSVPIGAILDIT